MIHDYAIIYNRGKRDIQQIITPDKKLVILDGRDGNGKMYFREPRLYDNTGGGEYIMFLGTEQECIDKLNKQ